MIRSNGKYTLINMSSNSNKYDSIEDASYDKDSYWIEHHDLKMHSIYNYNLASCSGIYYDAPLFNFQIIFFAKDNLSKMDAYSEYTWRHIDSLNRLNKEWKSYKESFRKMISIKISNYKIT